MRDMDATWKRLAADGEFTMKTRAVINGVTYDTITAPVITHGLLQNKTLSVGNCIAGTLEFTVMTSDDVPRSATIVIQSCLSDGTEDSGWHEMGTFWVDKRTVNSELEDYNLIDLECYDAMLKGNQAYSDNSEGLNWPKPMETVVTRIAQQMGVQIDERTHIKTGDDYVVTKPDDEMTLLDILGHIGALHGGNWTITPENKLRLVPIVFPQGDNSFKITDEESNDIVGNSDKIVWKYTDATGETNNAGGGLLNVPVVTGEIRTFGAKNSIAQTEAVNRVLGTYRVVSGTFYRNEDIFMEAASHGADTERQITSNAYAPSGQQVVCRFDASFNIPRGAQIDRVYCDVNGHAESDSMDEEYMCVQLVSGSTALSEQKNFKEISTTNATTRLECTTVPTRGQLASMELECTVGYYGGMINGATFYVEYTQGNDFISRVTVSVDKDTVYSVGNDNGIELALANNPYGTQRLCEALYAEFGGAEYVPFEITRAVYDPAAELGDWIVVGDRVTSVLYVETQTLDIGFIADASAPGEEEVDSEYPYTTTLQKMQYSVQGLSKDNEVMKSEIRQTQAQILLRVTAGQVESIIEQNADSIRLKAGKISWQSDYSRMTDDGVLTIQGAAITGSMSAVKTSSGINNGLLFSQGKIVGLYRNSNVFNIVMPYDSETEAIETIISDGEVVTMPVDAEVPEVPSFDIHEHMEEPDAGDAVSISTSGSSYGIEIGAGGKTAIAINSNGKMWLCPNGGLYVNNYRTFNGSITTDYGTYSVVNGLIVID